MEYILNSPIYQNISHFEKFLKVMGFKRIEGTIYGFLVLSKKPITSEEICKVLALSQGAVSQALRGLANWGAIESQYSPSIGAQTHRAVSNSLQIVSTIFSRREKNAMSSFKDSVYESIQEAYTEGDTEDDPRIQRLQSIISTCELAEVVMNFVNTVSRISSRKSYLRIFKALPKSLDLLVVGVNTSRGLADKVKSTFNSMRT